MMLDRVALQRLWPRAPGALIDGVAEQANDVLRRHGISTPLRIAHFLAQISHESDGGTVTRESLRYTTVARLLQIFGDGRHSAAITREEAPGYLRNPEALAERVYGLKNPGGKWKELGNTQPGDGYRYAGAGLLQITGRDNYRAIGKLCGLDLEGHPELAYDPAHALEVAAAEFEHLGCLPFCDADDLIRVTKRVNGGTNGLESRRQWLAKWRQVAADGQVAQPVKPAKPVPAPTPDQSKAMHVGVWGAAAAVLAAISRSFDAHPWLIAGVVVAVIIAAIAAWPRKAAS